MKSSRVVLLSLAIPLLGPVIAKAQLNILSPTDFIIGIDNNRNLPGNTNTGGEGPTSAFDGNDGSKWLSFGRSFAGLIVTPSGGPATVTSLSFTTANDAPERDPLTYQLFGTNNIVTTVNNGTGLEDSWTLISSGTTGFGPSTSPAFARNTVGPTQGFANGTAYSSYKVLFPQLRNAGVNAFDPVTLANGATPNAVQLSEVRLFDSLNTNVALFPTAIVAFDQTDSYNPVTERPLEAIDGNKGATSKYLNFGREGSGLIVTPAFGLSVISGFQITTANDTLERDPSSYEIYGTNSPIQSVHDSAGNAEPWTLITSGSMTLPDLRNTDGGMINFANSAAYLSYKVIFTDNKGPDAAANSIQFSEIQLYGVPEPTTFGLVAFAGVALLSRRRRA